MRIGLLLPQGYFGEFDGWDPVRAWARVRELAVLGERLGFETLWIGEHVTSKWGGPGSIAFDCWVLGTAIATATTRAEIGFAVLNSTLENPALTAKRAGTLDSISDGRLVLGLGAGFRQIEADTFGFPYPSLGERLAMLGEHFEIITRAVNGDEPPFSYEGRFARVQDLDNAPRGVRRPRVKILVAGRGPRVTFPLAARYADLFNLGVESPEAPELLKVFRDVVAAHGRDPDTIELQAGLNPSVIYRGMTRFFGQRMMQSHERAFAKPEVLEALGSRPEEIRRWADLGFHDFIAAAPGLHTSDEPLYELMEDIRAAGIEFPRAGWGPRSGEGPAPATARAEGGHA